MVSNSADSYTYRQYCIGFRGTR